MEMDNKKNELTMERWAALWREKNKLNGKRERFILAGTHPLLFKTRKLCNEFIQKEYGYYKDRADLRSEPFGWKIPKAVRVLVTLEEL